MLKRPWHPALFYFASALQTGIQFSGWKYLDPQRYTRGGLGRNQVARPRRQFLPRLRQFQSRNKIANLSLAKLACKLQSSQQLRGYFPQKPPIYPLANRALPKNLSYLF